MQKNGNEVSKNRNGQENHLAAKNFAIEMQDSAE